MLILGIIVAVVGIALDIHSSKRGERKGLDEKDPIFDNGPGIRFWLAYLLAGVGVGLVAFVGIKWADTTAATVAAIVLFAAGAWRILVALHNYRVKPTVK